MNADVTKRIAYNRANRDYDCFVQVGDDAEQYIGSAANYADAETKCRDYAFSYYEDRATPEKAAAVVMEGELSPEVAALTYPIFGRFAAQVEALGLPPIALDLGAALADELVAHFELTNTPEKAARLVMALA